MTMDVNYRNGGTTNGSDGINGHGTRRMLYRSPSDHMLGGVCGGVADSLGWDPALVRVLWVGVTLVTSGAGFFVYLLLWLLLPVGTQRGGQERAAAIQFNDALGKRLAVVLMVMGVVWLLNNLGVLPGLWGASVVLLRLAFWPLLLIAIGWLLLGRGAAGDWRERMAGWRREGSSWVSRGRAQMPSVGEAGESVQGMRQRIPLRRSRSNRILTGVCGGIGEALSIDASLVRLLWVVLSLGSMGFGIILYFVAAILLPEESTEATAAANGAETVQEVHIVDESNASRPAGTGQSVQF